MNGQVIKGIHPRPLVATVVLVAVLLEICFTAVPARAEVNNEGVSGLLSTPTAEVVRDGDAVFTVSRYLDDTLTPGEEYIARVYSATVGYLPGLEITARFADFPGRPDPNAATNYQDRSVAVKYQLYRTGDFTIAAGATDIGGYSKANKSWYGVVDYTGVPHLRLSAGAGSERFDGVFGGARWTPVKYASLVGEYDTDSTNYGVEVHPNPRFTLRAGVVNDHPSYAASFQFPLDPRGKDTVCCPAHIARGGCEYASDCDQAAAVRDALVAESFENVLVGVGGNTLFIDYENRRFRDQIDGLGVAAARALQLAGPGIEHIVVTPKLDDVPQLSIQAPVDGLLEFLNNPGTGACGVRIAEYIPGGCPAGTVYAEEGNKKPGGGDIYLHYIHAFTVTIPNGPTFPSLNGLGLEEDLYLARGLHLRARQDWPIHNDITDKNDPHNRDAYLRYLDKWSPGLFALASAGYFGDDRWGGTAEVQYQVPGTTFSVGGRSAWTRYMGGYFEDLEDTQYLGTASYYFPELDWELTALAGRFYGGDSGERIESTRTFGPTSLTYFAYDTDINRANGGFRFNIAMPWFSQGRHGDWRATGSPDFQFQYRTQSAPWGDLLLPEYNLSQVRGQLRPEYVCAHLDELRRAVIITGGACGCE